MAATASRLAFAVISRGRPEGLGRLIAALDAQIRAAGAADCELRVVLNQELDADYSAVLEVPIPTLPLAWRCCLEPGIPAARNALVSWLLEEQPAACVFLDDDEVPGEGWLARLLLLQERHPSAILTGPVLAEPAGPPSFLARHGAYDRVRRLSSGSATREAYTNNTLVPLAVLQALGPSFDRRFTATGGSDTDWFRRASAAGFEIRYFPELAVRETVEPARVPLRALLTRWLRYGSTDTLIRRKSDASLSGLLVILGRGFAKLAFGGLKALFAVLLLRWRAMLAGLRVALSGLGSLLGLFAISPRQY